MNSKKIKNWDRTQTWIPEKIYEPKEFEALISDYEGRPHWGKRFSGTHEKIRKLYSGPEYQNLDIYQVNCTYYSALECNDDSYIAARTIQFFAPGLPQVYYVGLLAGENDIELVERTKNGRDINRHNYSLDEIKVEIQKPVVHRLLRLMEFRNSYPAFDGQFVIAEAPDQLKLSWSQAPYHTTASIDLRSYSVQIEYYDKDQRKTKIFSA
jgi:sucrose phosphorylase